MQTATALLKVFFTQPIGLSWCACMCLLLGALLGGDVGAGMVAWAFGFGAAATVAWVLRLTASSPQRDDEADHSP